MNLQLWPQWCWQALLVATAMLAGCATTAPPAVDDSALRAARPASVLVLPPVNETPDVQAQASVWAQLVRPLAEAGYYVLPVSLVDETLRSNGIHTASDAQQIAPERLRAIFGADAALVVTIKRYGAVYQVIHSEVAVELQATLIDLRNGQRLWAGRSFASSAEQRQHGGGNLLGALVIAIVEHIANQFGDSSHPVAGLAALRLLEGNRTGGLLPGPRSPLAVPR